MCIFLGGKGILYIISMDWLKGKFTGNPHIQWENLFFPVDFPLNQSIDNYIYIYIYVYTYNMKIDQTMYYI